MTRREAIVGLVDYQAGNIRSIENAFDHLGARTRRVRVAADMDGVTHLLLPGVGAFGFCAERLNASGLVSVLRKWALDDGKPLLGICVGMQLMADIGRENGTHEGLGWIGGEVRQLQPNDRRFRVPHVGWNDVTFQQPVGDFAEGDRHDFYFDHSFGYFDPSHGDVVGVCDHGQRFAALVRRGNLIAAQFHPEKSQAAGLRFLDAFLSLPSC